MPSKLSNASGPDQSQGSLRDQAKGQLEAKLVEQHSAEDNIKLVEELTIHQEELNTRNEELKRIELELEATQAKYFELYDLAPLGYITLSPELIIKEANLAASKLLGCDRALLFGKGLSSFFPKGSHELLYLHFRRLARGQENHGPSMRVLRKDRVEVQVQFESNIVELGTEKGFRSILTDVTKLRKAEEALEKTRIELELEVQARTEDLQRSNAELQQFAYIASHDLQEPLRMVISYMTLLEKRYQDKLDPDAQEFIHYAVDGGKRMKDLIDDLLEYSRVDNKDKTFTSVDINDVMQRTLDGLAVMIGDNQVIINLDRLPTIIADESQMLQVMQNLVSNSVKFHGPERPIVSISATEQKEGWTFAVKDNGIGMSMEYSEKIFQMFQRLHTRDQFPGSGVGLAIVKKIVERHGGRVWVESEEGKGATFFFTIQKAPKKRA